MRGDASNGIETQMWAETVCHDVRGITCIGRDDVLIGIRLRSLPGPSHMERSGVPGNRSTYQTGLRSILKKSFRLVRLRPSQTGTALR